MSLDLPKGIATASQLMAITDVRLDIAAGRAVRAEVTRVGQRDPIPRWIRSLVHKRDQWTCAWCGAAPFAADPERRAERLNVDHIVPWSAGGSDHTDNLRTLCDACNRFRSNYASDMHTEKPLPIVRLCDMCRRGPWTASCEPFRAYCASKHHVANCSDGALIL
jgi:hypothetical protein